MEETSETLLHQTASHPLLLEEAEEIVVLEEAEVGLLPAGRPGLAAPVGEGLGLAVAPGEVPEVPVPAVPGPATPREVAEVEVLSRDAA